MSYSQREGSSLRRKVPVDFKESSWLQQSFSSTPEASNCLSCSNHCGEEWGELWDTSAEESGSHLPASGTLPVSFPLSHHGLFCPPTFQSFWSYQSVPVLHAGSQAQSKCWILSSRAGHWRPGGQAPFPPLHGIPSSWESRRSEQLRGISCERRLCDDSRSLLGKVRIQEPLGIQQYRFRKSPGDTAVHTQKNPLEEPSESNITVEVKG